MQVSLKTYGVDLANSFKDIKRIQNKNQKSNFSLILEQQLNHKKAVKISAHAQKRLVECNISLNNESMRKIKKAIDLAESKGAKDSLLIYGDIAMIANIKNRTIITAIDGSEDNKVFTNIDSAVFVK